MLWTCGSAGLALLSGCATYLRFDPAAPPAISASALPSLPLVIELVEVRDEGVPQLVNESLTNRVAMEFRQARIFESVIEPVDLHRAPATAVRATFTFATTRHAPATNWIGAMATGLSLLVLTPVFVYDFEARTDIDAALRSCDGWSKHFASHASGALRTRFIAEDARTEDALLGGVLERALGGLVAEIGSDPELRERTTGAVTRAERPCAR